MSPLPNKWTEGHWMKLYGFKQSKWIFHYRDKAELWKCFASGSSKWQVYMGSRAETTNWWKSFLRVTEILISHIQLMQPDRKSWMKDWMSPRKHPVCHIMNGWVSFQEFICSHCWELDPRLHQDLVWSSTVTPSSSQSLTQQLCAPQLLPPEFQPHCFKQLFIKVHRCRIHSFLWKSTSFLPLCWTASTTLLPDLTRYLSSFLGVRAC